jgi:DNA integrity scanning protein DisA with diadenylate cyclase activity
LVFFGAIGFLVINDSDVVAASTLLSLRTQARETHRLTSRHASAMISSDTAVPTKNETWLPDRRPQLR